MSAIIAGACHLCGEKYWLSLGHPEWFDKVFLAGKKFDEASQAYVDLCQARVCMRCNPRLWQEKMDIIMPGAVIHEELI